MGREGTWRVCVHGTDTTSKYGRVDPTGRRVWPFPEGGCGSLVAVEPPFLLSIPCDACAQGTLACMHVVQAVGRGGARMGKEYRFECDCGARLLLQDRLRWTVWIIRVSIFVPVLLLLLYFGVSILSDTVRHGTGGNDASAVYVVIALFIGAPVLFGVLIPLRLRTLLRGRRRYRGIVARQEGGSGAR